MTRDASTSRAPTRAIRQQALVVLVLVLALAVWFSATAVIPALVREWRITDAEAVWLTASVQAGFVIGAVTSAVANLADRVRPHLLLSCSSAGAAASTLLFAAFADGLLVGVLLRLSTGILLAGVYPVGMKLMLSWSGSHRRGEALGILVAALTLGSAVPHLIVSSSIDWRETMASAGGLALLGAVIALSAVRPGPRLPSSRAPLQPRYVITMFRERALRLVNIAYFGHMWELYAMWAWLPAYLLARPARDESGPGSSLLVFLAVGVAGIVGCLVGGFAADLWSRARTATLALAVSGTCCLLSPMMFGMPEFLLVAFLLVWGASVIADSGVLSTMLSERADPDHVGTALTAQTAIGFLITIITIQCIPLVAGLIGWQFAFLLLVPGPIAGVVALIHDRRTPVRRGRRTDGFIT